MPDAWRWVSSLENGSRQNQTFAWQRWQIVAGSTLLGGVALWSYWPVFAGLVQIWSREADYSHGFLVIPAALGFLWLKREVWPPVNPCLSLGGLLMLGLSGAMRAAGALWYVPTWEQWSLPVWLAGACWLLGGWRFLRFCAPSIGFLAFMIPLPYRVEGLFSQPLQGVATQCSCWLLQCLGQPAVAEGNVVVIDETRLLVAEACSGLRIFMSILALAYAYCVLAERPTWIKFGLALSILPIAIITNSLRIAGTGLAHEYLSAAAAKSFAHDLAGWLMLPVAAVLMYFVSSYLSRVFIEVETVSARQLLNPLLVE